MDVKIPSSTLVETLAALTIIMLSFGLALVLYGQVITGSRINSTFKLFLLADGIAGEGEVDSLPGDETGVITRTAFLPFKGDTSGIKTLLFEGFDHKGQKIFSFKKIVTASR
ncbi:MAG: hypothetical protein HYY40_11840 [Bacteroidetes bacterium]|nr:hypothetical protein [Bacteroidota bacterium]